MTLPSRARRATLVTVHGHGLTRLLRKRWSPRAWLARKSLNRFTHLLAVSDSLQVELREALPGLPVTTVPAFIQADGSSVPNLQAKLASPRESRNTLVASAYRVSFHFGDRDDYGLDMAVELLIRLAPSNSDLRLAIFLAVKPKTPKQIAYLSRLRRRVAEAGIEDRLLILVDEPLTAAFESGCVYLRPTRTDGDAVSVREALAARVPVVASDVAERPAGTMTLPIEDIDAWTREVINALGPPAATSTTQSSATKPNRLIPSLRSMPDTPGRDSSDASLRSTWPRSEIRPRVTSGDRPPSHHLCHRDVQLCGGHQRLPRLNSHTRSHRAMHSGRQRIDRRHSTPGQRMGRPSRPDPARVERRIRPRMQYRRRKMRHETRRHDEPGCEVRQFDLGDLSELGGSRPVRDPLSSPV